MRSTKNENKKQKEHQEQEQKTTGALGAKVNNTKSENKEQ